MTQTLVIAAREIRERAFVLLFAAVIATLPFIVLNLPGSRRAGGFEFIGAVGSVTAANFTMALAFILGASILGRELTERRLSFYFARPVNASVIWFGKLLAAVVLLGVSFAIIFVPSLLAGRSTWERGLDVGPGQVVVFTAVLAFTLFLISHALSTAVRSRSGFAAVDLVATAIAIGAAWVIVMTLVQAFAIELVKVVAVSLLAGLVLSLIGAGAWQLSRGRADVKRSHIEMSKFFWISLAIVLAAAGAYTTWVFAVDVDDLTEAGAAQTGRGDWAAVAGTSPLRGDFYATFLLNLASGEAVRFPAAKFTGPEFSRNGDAAYSQAAPIGWRGRASTEILLHRFGRDERPLRTGITDRGSIVVSDDLNRIAVVGNTTVAIHEIDTQRLVASAAMPKRRSWQAVRAFFVTPDVLRIVNTQRDSVTNEASPMRVTIIELHAVTRQIVQTGSWTTTATGLNVQASADGGTLLVNRFGNVEGPRMLLLDARTGAVRATLPAESGGFLAARVLADGSIAVVSTGPERTLRLFASDGSLIRETPIGNSARIRVINETAAGQLIVGLYGDEKWQGATGKGWETIVVDLKGGGVTRRERDIVPAHTWWPTDPRVGAPNATGEIVVTDAAGDFWRWNASTGGRKKLI